MFTGIVDHCGAITAISRGSNAIRLSISTQFNDLTLGESICVDGVCLTVTNTDLTYFECDLSPETLHLTLAKNYSVGDSVNLERSMRISDRLGGHIVTGHVDGVLRIKTVEMQNEFVCCEFFEINASHHLLLTPKGSVCINGVSLTINSVDPQYFSVMLIPHTLQRTNLHRLKINDCVNVEYDYLAKLVQRNISHFMTANVGE
ncbi:MAG: riboflavin synthase subunit alpha [Gammaproteobacteria bacterium RIFCSPHIGHO2_12_FULL_40_19]|nr:MAG: riboflavin synthase subunit alpha [Gammaproteobacteria bacterium RIFCSPHIGHO2_12_FULL_40_19]